MMKKIILEVDVNNNVYQNHFCVGCLDLSQTPEFYLEGDLATAPTPIAAIIKLKEAGFDAFDIVQMQEAGLL